VSYLSNSYEFLHEPIAAFCFGASEMNTIIEEGIGYVLGRAFQCKSPLRGPLNGTSINHFSVRRSVITNRFAMRFWKRIGQGKGN